MKGSRFRVQGSGVKVQGSRMNVQGSRFKVQGSGLRERFNEMKIRRITNFDFMHIAHSDLRGMDGRQIQKIDLMAVSAVKRAAEGEI